MTKLLTEEELIKAIREIHERLHGRQNTHREVAKHSKWSGMELGNVLTEDMWLFEKEMSDLIQSQKVAHADMVIGEDKLTLEYVGKKADKSQNSAVLSKALARDELRAEQRKVNKV